MKGRIMGRRMGPVMMLAWALVAGIVATAGAQETVRVTVLPFAVHAPEDFAYLRDRIPEVIAGHLTADGAEVLPPEMGRRVPPANMQTVRRIGRQTGADYVIWGSFTRIGDQFSLDGRMIDIYGRTPLSTFFVEGQRIEALPSVVRDLTRQFGTKLFKRERVAQVQVRGNRRIEADAIKRVIETAPGDVYLARSLSKDLRAVYAMGYFDDIRVEAADGVGGKIITFHVKEKPTIRMIRFTGNRVYDDTELTETLSISTGSILNVHVIQSNLKRIEAQYKDKNYHNVSVDYTLSELDNNQADLTFTIDEGQKIRIRSISFAGNSAYPDKRLKKIMKTSEKGFWSWITSSGDLDRDVLERDVARITEFYHNHGHIDARVSDPQIAYTGSWIDITIKIDEGRAYDVGRVALSGDLIQSEAALMNRIRIDEETRYSREVVRKDVMTLTDIYGDDGFANAEIIPRADRNPDKGTVDITYVINKGKLVYFEKIVITGNTKTRDKVIRRQLKVYEKDRYSGSRLKRSIRNLHRLDYFEDIRVNSMPGSSDDQAVLRIDVTEKPTGTFSFGGGYSSVENLFAMASISQRNLFGRGQTLQVKAELGSTTSRYTLSFTEPWLFDIPLSAGFDLYNWERDYDTYDKDSQGGAVRFGYPVFDFTRLYLSYRYDIGDITNISEDASDLVWDMEGTNVTSSVATTLRYDSRDRVFNPTEGADHRVSVEYAGLGGDIAFTKYIGELGQYIPLFWGTVGFLHGKSGFVDESSGGKLPDYERFYLGGMNSMRGFDWRDISAYDEEGKQIGGDKFVQFNAEYLIPLIKEAGVVGVLFYDTGNVFNTGENIDFNNLRESAGYGFRWYSPMGPIRIENGYILNPEEGESTSGRWEFTMGGAF